MDAHGTRGMASLASSVDRISEAVTQLRTESVTRWGEHTRQHSREARERASARRWRITTTIAAIATSATFLGLLVAILNTLATARR